MDKSLHAAEVIGQEPFHQYYYTIIFDWVFLNKVHCGTQNHWLTCYAVIHSSDFKQWQKSLLVRTCQLLQNTQQILWSLILDSMAVQCELGDWTYGVWKSWPQ